MELTFAVHRTSSQITLRRRVESRNQEIREQFEAAWEAAIAFAHEHSDVCVNHNIAEKYAGRFADSMCLNCKNEPVILPFGFFCINCESRFDDIYSADTGFNIEETAKLFM